MVALTLAIASFDPAFGWIIPMGLGGGAIIAALRFIADWRNGHASLAVDRFSERGIDIINMSSIRVAGIGGLGLVLVAGAVALQYELIRVALVAGLVGGAFAALIMIVSYRSHARHAA